MGRHRTPEEKRQLGERARALRAAGRSRREIMAELHVGDDLLGRLLAGTEVPDALRRTRAKDDLREQARVMREAGATYDAIAAALGVSKSSCSLWLRDLPRPEDDPARRAAAEARRAEALRARLRRDRDARDEQGRRISEDVASSLGEVTSRDLVLALAVSYWCEGGKAKPWNRSKRIAWMNSDPVLVRLFLEGLALLDVGPDRVKARLHIHETADEPAQRAWWSEQVGIPLEQFTQHDQAAPAADQPQEPARGLPRLLVRRGAPGPPALRGDRRARAGLGHRTAGCVTPWARRPGSSP